MEEDQVEAMEGVKFTNLESSPPLLTPDEQRVLDLYDRLEELQLEIALLKVQGVLSQDEASAEGSEEDIKQAEEKLLQAKARYQVRKNIIESVLVANPTLKAVHAGSNATTVEKDLLPLIQKRDARSIALSELSSRVQLMQKNLEKVQRDNYALAQTNAELSTRMLALAEEANTQRKEDIDDPQARQELEELEAEMRISRQRFRIMKGTASATIAGSGIDWARDPTLLEIVLDEDGDDG